MELTRVKGILVQEFFITKRSVEVLMDIFVFPGASIVVFSFLSAYIAGSANSTLGHSLLMGMLLWQMIFIMQYSVTVGSLWSIWARNLSNIFTTPITITEYIFAFTISGAVKSLLIFGISAWLLSLFFGFNILSLGFPIVCLYVFNLLFFAFSLGLVILGMIFKYGTRIQAFAWGLLPLFQPICAALYPIKVLPPFLQVISYALPPSYIFESARQTLAAGTVNWQDVGVSLVENVIYFILAIIFFQYMFKKSKETGQFARNEG